MPNLLASIYRADNGLIIRWPDELDDDTKINRQEVFEDDEDDEWFDQRTWCRMLNRLLELFGPSGSKHDKFRLTIRLVDQSDVDWEQRYAELAETVGERTRQAAEKE